MTSKALLSTRSLRRACTLGIVLSVAILTTNAEALAAEKVTIIYSLEVLDGGSYRQEISDTLFGAGDADFIFYQANSGDGAVTVFVDNPLLVTIVFTADSPGGNIIDGLVVLADTHFEREFEIDSGPVVTNILSTHLSRRATGMLSGSEIIWDNVEGVNAYQELVNGLSDCEGDLCGFVGPWPRFYIDDLNEVPLPKFTLDTNTSFAYSFASDNGTGDNSDDINRPDPDATVKDTWNGVAVPEPSREILLLAGALGLVGLSRLRERGGVSA